MCLPGADENVVYQNEEGNWVTDLAYYSSFDKEFDANMPEKNKEQFKTEDFLPASKNKGLLFQEICFKNNILRKLSTTLP